MMKTVTIYSQNTGEIHSCLTCHSHEVESNIPSGCAFVEGFHPSDRYVIENGVPKEKPTKTPDEIEAEEIEKAWDQLRRDRNFKLSVCDWTQVTDAPVDQQAWATYRQALRDLPTVTVNPNSVVWPTKPE